jgi:Cdc6-like AAA superfamily ATPase
MTSLPDNRATTLKAAFRACDVSPLVGDIQQRYYVDLSKVRNTEAIQSVTTRLEFLEPAEFCTILFTGHRGCGKSTELRRIQQSWESEYRVIYLEADAELDINDAEYTDLYLVIIKSIANELYKIGLKFDAKLLSNFETWFKEITQENESTVERSISLEASAEAGAQIPFLSKLLAKLQSQIKGSERQKEVIRQTLQKDIGRLQADINLLLGDAFVKVREKYPECKKGFLVIFDNLDRVPPNVGNHLFFDYAAQLQGLHCTVIYTAPISIVYSEKNLGNAFDTPNIVPMVNIYQFDRDRCDLEHDPEGLEAVASLIEQRVEVDAVFESRQLLLEIAKASGGHVRQLMQITARACLTAATRQHNKVTTDDVSYAIKQEQYNFERIIPTEHYPVLAQVCLTKDITKDETGRLMLFNLSVFEYNGKNRWNYINSVVKQSDAFQKALQAAKKSP